jgi:acetyltransferase-like isoleucine patch superfamily enzyme/acyl carrier protein
MPISTPPLNYKLDREGTSGIAVGPEITILDGSHQTPAPGTIGRISVRGGPLFAGYLKPDGTLDTSAFNEAGWFDTGDLGYLDQDGFLYITGRSKEVINRGGEIISPFEVEDAIVTAANDPDSPIYQRVSQALAFGVNHDVLQEVAAIVLVTPADKPRVDLRTLHLSLKSSLQQAKWPALIVYMDDVPKRNNKILRTNLAKRLSLPEQKGDTSFLERHWNAVCPPVDTDLKEPIPASTCSVVAGQLMQVANENIADYLQAWVDTWSADKRPELILAPAPNTEVTKDVGSKACTALKELLATKVHNYWIPERIQYLNQPFPVTEKGSLDVQATRLLAEELRNHVEEIDASTIEDVVRGVVAKVLSKSPTEVAPDADFFDLGGDSILAGRLLSMLRNEFKISLPIEFIFNHGSSHEIANYLEQEGATLCGSSDSSVDGGKDFTPKGPMYSSTNPFLMALQLVPMTILYPMRRAFQWTIFLIALSSTLDWETNQSMMGRLFILVVSIAASKVIAGLTIPWVGIIAKWLIIGRYQAGEYPMWGPYHTRWWMAQKVVDVCGMGFFGLSNGTRIAYLRLMGATIGRDVTIKGAKLGEWDLIEIRDGAVLDGCVCRPFGAERNTTMYLGQIRIGLNVVVCRSSIVAPGTTIPDETCIGPNSSSWELEDADESFRDLSGTKIPGAHWVLTAFGTVPLSVVCAFLSMIPWCLGLLGLVMTQPIEVSAPIRSIVHWFASGGRVGYHYLALVLRSTLSPFVIFAFTVAVRVVLDRIFGKLEPSPAATRSQVDRWRMALMKTLMPVSRLHDMTEILGQHYETTSIAVRLLGGKVGKRVYWPGTGPAIGDYHLIDIGNDVVFGSRAHMITSDALSSERIKINANAMIADRVCLLPGVTVGRKAVLGSGALTRRDKFYDDETTWVGSRGGDAICLAGGNRKDEKMTKVMSVIEEVANKDSSVPTKGRVHVVVEEVGSSSSSTTGSIKAAGSSSSMTLASIDNEKAEEEETLSPFGRAFYRKAAPYTVFGEGRIFMYSAFFTAFTAAYWNVSFIFSIQCIYIVGFDKLLGLGFWRDAMLVWGFTTLCIAFITTILSILALGLVIGAKWWFIGRRTPGNYDWDKSSYCQRWQLFLSAEKLRRHCFRGQGILGMLTGTHWIVMYFRALGATIGKDCALFANGHPSLMFTEPDLLTMGDRVTVDDASLVGHINTRGHFDLNELHVGDRCVLRTGSRLLSGASMMDDSCLLEHTLVMGGDVVDERTTLQGWPARVFRH